MIRKGLLTFVGKCLSFAGYRLVEIPYSRWKSTVYFLFHQKSWRRNNEMAVVSSTELFGTKVFFQKNDFRATFFTCWNEEAVRPWALHIASRVCGVFDFYDVGSNYGLYSIPFQHPTNGIGARVAIEPNPFLRRCLRETLTERFSILPFALVGADDLEMVQFGIMPHGSGASSVNQRNASRLFQVFEMDVPTLRFSQLFSEWQASEQAVVKIDIEGNELNLLRSGLMSEISKRYNDFILFIEFLVEDSVQAAEFVSYLADYSVIRFSRTQWKASPSRLIENSNTIRVADFYELKITNGVAAEDMVGESDMDLMVFSNFELAKKALDFFGRNCKLSQPGLRSCTTINQSKRR